MKKYEKIYQELRKRMSDKEIAESMLLPEDLTNDEKNQLHEEMRAFRFKILREQTEAQRVQSDLMRLRFQMKEYVKDHTYSEDRSFNYFLSEYVRILNRTKKTLSEELNIHYTKLSRIFSGKDEPNVKLMYRLEEHSGKLIPSLLWWKLVIKKQEYFIKKDTETRKAEAAKVKNAMKFRA